MDVLNEETVQKLLEMRLSVMAQALREMLASAPGDALSFDEKIGMIVDREWTDRRNRQLARRIKQAKIGMSASLEDLWCEPARGLDKAQMRDLAKCHWVPKQNVIAEGATDPPT